MMTNGHVGSDHCRVVPPSDGTDLFQSLQYFRHLFAYAEAERQLGNTRLILEIGTGEGYGASYLSSRCPEIVATDLSWDALRHASTHYPKVLYCQTLGTDLAFSSASFDAVISFQVIEHIEDASSYLGEVRRVLKPGGRFILTTPNRKLRLLPFQKPWNGYHIREYSGRQLRRQLGQFFDSFTVSGVVAEPQLMAFEIRRVKQDPIRVYGGFVKRALSTVLPQRIVESLKRVVVIARDDGEPLAQTAETLTAATLEDFSLTTDCDAGMDLFAVAVKSER